MPRNRTLSTDEQVLSELWTASRSSEQLVKKLGIPLYAIKNSCKALKERRMIQHGNDLWQIHYRDGKFKKVVEVGHGTLSEILSAYNRKVRNKATVDGRKKYSGTHGSKAEWKEGARRLVGSEEGYYKYLVIFNLKQLPTIKELKHARKVLIKKAHPDLGGHTHDAAIINAAYKELLKLISK
jgi:hypothetical protein